jgi:hypothetical protein
MQQPGEELPAVGALDDLAEGHHRDAVGHLGDRHRRNRIPLPASP